MIRIFTYASENPGPRFLVLGAVHGNESCGAVAIERVVEDFSAGRLSLLRGQVTFVPVCNPRARQADVRFIERNLNRYLVPVAKPKLYEEKLGNILCPLLERCDVLLDIHSYTVGGPPFALIENGTNASERDLAACLGADAIIHGWAAAYAATGRKPTSQTSGEESTGTTEYARRFGAVATTLECGQHKNPGAPEIAYRAILRALLHLGLIESAAVDRLRTAPPMVRMTHVFYRDDEGAFVKPWRNLEPVAKGDIIAKTATGQPITAPDDGMILLPHATSPIGQEWFYVGVTA